ncbi:ABC transporter substrate-binding protein [Synechococcus sp. ATX 2A4]|uniref:hypothetical protein n=1 Tax=Synechococcus sp. ATX 2A4 TaxID=2823727 RepID=UPI0020CCBAA0|nr:hypothetical protein [Synechococcus sp. ATX 2A4]MCP9884491.1 ABC transporter substrate-binding protein [Synechococcus sp. ATX 2A4]
MQERSPLPARFSRRRLLQAGALAGSGWLVGCARGASSSPTLLYSRGQLPAAWGKQLPSPWRGKALEGPEAVLAQQNDADLLQLSDGWLGALEADALQPFSSSSAASALFEQLAPFTEAVRAGFRNPPAAPIAYPWAFGTWVLVLRNRSDLSRRSAEGWNLLLDPSLRRQLVLPSSPRVVIELALRTLSPGAAAAGSAPAATAGVDRLAAEALPGQLKRLRQQALAFDDKHGLNLLLSGDAEAAVLPSQRVLPLLRSDARLTALLPASGSPLWWNLLLRPRQSREPAPLAWIARSMERPTLDRLLAAGWVPPLKRQLLRAALEPWPEQVARLLYPDDAVLARCTSLPPLNSADRQRYQSLWDAAA